MPTAGEWAARYAELGLRVFPCGRDKRPLTERGFHDATTDPAVIAEWWRKSPRANIGVAVPDDVIVLDLDDGDEGVRLLAAFDHEIPATVTGVTSKGYHFWFRVPDEWVGRVIPRTSIFPKIDVRAPGSYVIVPPSVHETGKIYRWKVPPTPGLTNLSDAPDWLLEAAERRPDGSTGLVKGTEDWTRVLSDGVEEGSRDDRLFKFACHLRAQGYERDDAEAVILLSAARCNPPFDAGQAMRKVEQAWRYPGKSLPATPSVEPAPSKRKMWTVEELLAADLPEPKYLVEPILPVGLALLVAPAKSGKSFLVGEIAASTAAGALVMGAYSAEEGETLYLDLEQIDWRSRARWRLLKQNNDLKGRVRTQFSWDRMDQGGLEALEQHLQDYPQTRLIVIDVWAKFKPSDDAYQGDAYHRDYAMLTPLQDLAHKYSVCILLVHHTNKHVDYTDPLSCINGSAAYSAVPDTVWVIQRSPGEPDGKLYVTGKAVESEWIDITFHPHLGKWTTRTAARYTMPAPSTPVTNQEDNEEMQF